jgi:MFS family permease
MVIAVSHHFIGGALGIANPSIRADYKIDIIQLAWIGTAYFLPYVALMPVVGRLADNYGLKKTLSLGMLVFLVGTLACVIIPSFPGLVVGRVLQGIGTAGINPISMAAIQTSFPTVYVGTVTGIWQSSGILARVLGSSSAGWIIEFWGWRTIFWITLGLGAIGGLLLYYLVPSDGDKKQAISFDWIGTILLTACLVTILYAISTLKRENQHPALLYLLIAIGLGELIGFWFYETKLLPKERQLFNISLLSNPCFTRVSILAGLRMCVVGGSYFILPLYLEEVSGIRPGVVGLIVGSSQLMIAVGSIMGGRISDKFGLNHPNVMGMIVFTLGLFMMSRISATVALPYIVLAVALQGLGTGLALVAQHRIAGSTLSSSGISSGFGVYNAIRFFGDAGGPIIAGVMLNSTLLRSPATVINQTSAYASVFLLLTVIAACGVMLSFFITK